MKITYLMAIALLINSNIAIKIRDESDYNLPLLGDDEKEKQLKDAQLKAAACLRNIEIITNLL